MILLELRCGLVGRDRVGSWRLCAVGVAWVLPWRVVGWNGSEDVAMELYTFGFFGKMVACSSEPSIEPATRWLVLALTKPDFLGASHFSPAISRL